MKNTKLPSLNVKLESGNQSLELSRYEWNHLLDCMGLKVAAWGTIPADEFRFKLDRSGKAFKLTPQEFTASEQIVTCGKDQVTMAAIDAKKLGVLMSKLCVFAESIGDRDLNY